MANVVKTVMKELKAVSMRSVYLEQVDVVVPNADDPLTDSVFTDGLRGKTDRFVYLFRKP